MNTFFISSTFTDMHRERDCLRQEIFPNISETAFQYGEDIGLRDLRWGVHKPENLTEEETNEHVLSVCFDEIDACRPYMIVLIGNCYGTTYEKKRFEDILKKKLLTGGEDAVLSLPDDMQRLSITEMEIRYGTMRCSEDMPRAKVIFYIRELEGGNIPSEYRGTKDDRCYLDNLKQMIKELKAEDGSQDNIILWYDKAAWDNKTNSPDNMQRFSEQMTKHILKLMQKEWENARNLTDYQKELKQHSAYARENSEKFFFRAGILKTICEHFANHETDFTAIQGEPGSGKTFIMSYLAVHPQEVFRDSQGICDISDIAVLPLFCGYTPMTCQAVGLMRHMTAFIEEQSALQEPDGEYRQDLPACPADEEKSFEELRTRLEKSIWDFDRQAKQTGRRILILIDSVDQLDASKIRDNLLFLPRELPSTVHMIISCVKQFDLSFWKDRVTDIHNLDEDKEIEGLLNKMLSASGKETEEQLINTMKKKAHSSNPLYLSLLVQRLVMMEKKDYETIHKAAGKETYDNASIRYRNQMIEECPDELNSMCRHILNAASRQIGGKTAQMIVQYISASRHGLRQSDLEQIFQLDDRCNESWNSLSFSQFYKYMRNLFIIREDGRYDFSHLSIRNGFLELTKKKLSMRLHKKILKHLKALPMLDPLRMNEIIYHCWQANNKKYLISYLCSICRESGKLSETTRVQLHKAAARSIYDICTAGSAAEYHDKTRIKNGAKWFCDVLDKCKPWKHPENTALILHFIHSFLTKAFEDSLQDLTIQTAIYEKCLKLAESLHKEKDNEESLGILADACYQLGNVCHRKGGTLNYSQALGLYLREAQITGSLQNRRTAARDSLLRKSANLSHLGDIYSDMGGHENHNRALRAYLKSREILARLLKQTGRKEQDSVNLQFQRICQKVGFLQASAGWKSYKEAHNNYKKAQEILSQYPLACKREQIELNLCTGDLLLGMHGKENAGHTIISFYQKAKETADVMRGEPPKAEHELIWLICYERISYAAVLLEQNVIWRDIYDHYQFILGELAKLLPENQENSQNDRDNVNISNLKWIQAVFSEHAADFGHNKKVSDEDILIAGQLLQDAEISLEELCRSDNSYYYRRDLTAVYCRRADILTEMEKRNLMIDGAKLPDNIELPYRKALIYYKKALREAKAIMNESRTPESRHDYLAVLAKIGDLYSLNTEADYIQKAEVYYMQSLEEAISLDKEVKSPMGMTDISYLCGRIAQVCTDKRIAAGMEKRSRLLADKARRLAEDAPLPENSFDLHCRQVLLKQYIK